MKSLAHCFVFLLVTFAVGSAARATAGENYSTAWESAVYAVESSVLKSMHDLASKKEWDPAKAHLVVYRDIGSCPSAAEAIGKMLISKNRDGALAVIQLARDELIHPHRGPVTSTRQVKRSFVRAIQASKKQESKSALIVTFLDVFSLDCLTPSEKVALQELQRMVEEGLLKTAATIEKIFAVVIEEVGNLSPLDDRDVSFLHPEVQMPTEDGS